MRGMERSAAVSRLPHLSCQRGLNLFQLGCPAVPALVCKYPQSSELGNQSVSLKLNTIVATEKQLLVGRYPPGVWKSTWRLYGFMEPSSDSSVSIFR